MGLSSENINKLHMNGIYRCEPVLKWLPSYKQDSPYWCKNWTFKVSKYGDDYYMRDTYWASGDDHPIKLTDENFDLFEFLFDRDEVKTINFYKNWIEYPEKDRWKCALDSGGWSYPAYLVKKDAHKDKDKVLERLRDEINSLRCQLLSKERDLQRVLDGTADLDYV